MNIHRVIPIILIITKLSAESDISMEQMYKTGMRYYSNGNCIQALPYLLTAVDSGAPMQAKYHLAMAHLGCRNFKKGFAILHDYMLEEAPLSNQWHGEDLTGKSILVRAPQINIGDIFIFMRFLDWLKQLGAQVLVSVQDVLCQFFCNQGFGPIFCATGCPYYTTGEKVAADYQVFLTSIPAILNRSMDTMHQGPYLQVNQERMNFWAGEMSGYTKKMGMYVNNKDIPVEMLGQCMNEKMACYCLQNLTRIPHPTHASHCADRIVNGDYYVEVAAMMKNLDVVVTDDTTIADLAGGLGVKVMMLAPQDADWRYPMRKMQSSWHKTMMVFRKTRIMSWSTMMQRMMKQMQECMQ